MAGVLSAQETPDGDCDHGAEDHFEPHISLILDGSYVWQNHSDEKFESLVTPGIPSEQADAEGHSHHGMNSHQGFNPNYGKLVIASEVDSYFDLFAVFHLPDEAFAIEEAYFTTRHLPWGLQLKGGKFFSHFDRYTHMAEYTPSEFSRLRLQYNRDGSRYELTSPATYAAKTVNEIFMQISLDIGGHHF